MRQDNVPARKICASVLDDLQQSFVVRHEDLNVIAMRRQLAWRTHKIRHGPRRPVPHENRRPCAAKMRRDCATDDPKADYTNVLIRWVRRRCEALHQGKFTIRLPGNIERGNAEISSFDLVSESF